ncbi:MAG: DinB family protein [Acidobacteriota bacterium]|nr:DinB family protein [Acidobacteriota bacterium]
MAKTEFEHPAIDQIAATPEILRLMMGPVSDAQARWKPAADRWSIAEVLEHLSHIEGHYFRAGVEAMLTGSDPAVEPYDQKAWEAEGAYAGRDPEESFAHFEEQREGNVQFLRDLEINDLPRSGRHPGVGKVTIGDYLNEWALHDLGHIRQIAELIRAQLYFPGLGGYQSHYTVRP